MATDPVSSGHLDELDGLNATRALILQGYYALRRRRSPRQIGTGEIRRWIRGYEPQEALPSNELIQLTLTLAGVPHRRPGRPRNEGAEVALASPFLAPHRNPALRPNRPPR
jgi:hypothetical protein